MTDNKYILAKRLFDGYAREMYVYTIGIGHSKRVSEYSKEIMKRLTLDVHEIEDIECAALLHDIGKVKLPSEILSKSGSKLSDDDARILKLHSEYGSDMIKQNSEFACISEIVKAHHENYDGTGFPDGAKGDDIPLGARIIKIADVYDAITYDKPCEKAHSPDYAKNFITANSDKLFDPKIVDAFVAAFEAIEKLTPNV